MAANNKTSMHFRNVNNSWSNEVEDLLNTIKTNSADLGELHRANWVQIKQKTKYFDIPVIVLSVLSSTFSVGATPYISQSHVSLTNCFISMFIAIITSIKLYLNLDETIKKEYESSQAFRTLSLELAKIMRLRIEQRNGDGLDCLNKYHNLYIKLIENSTLLNKKITKNYMLDTPPKKSLMDRTSRRINASFFGTSSSSSSSCASSPTGSELPNLDDLGNIELVENDVEKGEVKM